MPERERESKNRSLHKAKKDKFNEFYTQKRYIEKELKFYKNPAINPAIFAGKTVYCNCDDPEQSEFWRYFKRSFNELKLKKLIATHYEPNDRNYTYKIELPPDNCDRVDISTNPVKTPLYCNGDFRSGSCIELLKESDIVVTNPPFSLFREYIAQLLEYGKKFLVIGNINAITYKEIFPHLRNGDIWLGRHSGPMEFFVPDFYTGSSFVNQDNQRCAKLGNICWFTNLDIPERHEKLNLHGNYYSSKQFPKYENYNAIEVARIAEIPQDYDGVIGVPVTYMLKHCPEQFEIIGMAEDNGKGLSGCAGWDGANPHCIANGKTAFKRIFIKRKDN